MNKNKIIKIISITLFLLLISGCTKYLRNTENQPIIYEKTGQSITSNILCKPTDPELIKIYNENAKNLEIDLKDLPTCKEFKPSDIKYTGLWESVFVKPLALLIIKIGNIVQNYGLSVMLVGLLIRLALIPLNKKNLEQTKKMKAAQFELSAIEKKYKGKKDQESNLAKNQETVLVYNKHGINPVTGCVFSLIQFPLFLAFLEAINRVPAIFEGKLLSLQLGTSPLLGINKGNYSYIIIIILVVFSTYFSLKNSQISPSSTPEQAKQGKFMQIFMLLFISIASLNLPTAIALYWTITNFVTAVQNVVVNKKEAKK